MEIGTIIIFSYSDGTSQSTSARVRTKCRFPFTSSQVCICIPFPFILNFHRKYWGIKIRYFSSISAFSVNFSTFSPLQQYVYIHICTYISTLFFVFITGVGVISDLNLMDWKLLRPQRSMILLYLCIWRI